MISGNVHLDLTGKVADISMARLMRLRSAIYKSVLAGCIAVTIMLKLILATQPESVDVVLQDAL